MLRHLKILDSLGLNTKAEIINFSNNFSFMLCIYLKKLKCLNVDRISYQHKYVY